MILAALLLLGIGVADLVRQFAAPRLQWSLLGVLALALIVVGVLFDSVPYAVGALVLAAIWVWLLPVGHPPRAGAWPAVVLVLVVAASTVVGGARSTGGVLGDEWHISSPFGEIPGGLALLVLGVGVFLLESANVVVRLALLGDAEKPTVIGPSDRGEDPSGLTRTVDTEGESSDRTAAAPLTALPRLKGGRLIGPLERILIAALTLTGAYALVAALIAAKGIVRFPEISKDDSSGGRAEYFLVGSLVSWVQAVAAAFVIWWGFLG